jgi:hypothetical protein
VLASGTAQCCCPVCWPTGQAYCAVRTLMHAHVRMYSQFIISMTTTMIIIIIIRMVIIIVIIIIDMFGTCCLGSWPMIPASGADLWSRPVRLVSGLNYPGPWCWPLMPPSAAVLFAGSLGKYRGRSAHSCTHLLECNVNSSSPSPSSLSSSS